MQNTPSHLQFKICKSLSESEKLMKLSTITNWNILIPKINLVPLENHSLYVFYFFQLNYFQTQNFYQTKQLRDELWMVHRSLYSPSKKQTKFKRSQGCIA